MTWPRATASAIAYEALAWSKYVPTYEKAWEVVEAVDHPYVGLCLDSFHLFSSTSTLDGIATIPGEKIFFCQLADAPALSLDPLSWSRHHRLFPGQGNFDLVGFTDAVIKAGYEGPLSLEVFNDVFRQSDPRRTAIDAQRSLRYLQDVVRRGADDYPDAPHLRLDRLTPVPPAERFDFIEIRSGEDPELVRTLQAMGFDHPGTTPDETRRPVEAARRAPHRQRSRPHRLGADGRSHRDPG